MKRLLLIFLTICFLITAITSLSIKTTLAESLYLRVITSDTPFYSGKESEKPLFYLPYTYYVKVIREEADFYYVEYGEGKDMPSIDGYVPKGMLFNDGLFAESRYPLINITTSTHTLLYLDNEKTSAIRYVFQDRTLVFYGIATSLNGENLYYVSYNNKLGYVSEEDVVPFSIPNHQNELTFLPKEEQPIETPQETPKENKNSSLRYVIIGCLALAGLFALIVVLKNKHPQNEYRYFEENEYE